MTYKTKIGIAIGVGFGFIIVMAIVMFVFVSNNSETGQVANSNQTQNTTNSVEESPVQDEILSLSPNQEIEMTIDNVSSLGIEPTEDGDYLVKISNDLETENIVNLNNIDGFIGYDYQEETVYLAFNKTGSGLIYSINLNDNSENFITELEYSILNSFYVYDGYIYCVTVNNSIYRYNIEEDSGEEFIIPEENETIIKAELDKKSGILYYMKNSVSEDTETTYIYRYDLEENANEEIINAGFRGNDIILYNNYLVCNLLNTSFYIYNIENSSLWELGTIQEASAESNALQNIAFLENYIAFSDGKNVKITDYDGNTLNSELYVAQDNETVLDILALTKNKLQIRTDNETDNIRVIDFESSTIGNESNSYIEVLQIK